MKIVGNEKQARDGLMLIEFINLFQLLEFTSIISNVRFEVYMVVSI